MSPFPLIAPSTNTFLLHQHLGCCLNFCLLNPRAITTQSELSTHCCCCCLILERKVLHTYCLYIVLELLSDCCTTVAIQNINIPNADIVSASRCVSQLLLKSYAISLECCGVTPQLLLNSCKTLHRNCCDTMFVA